MARRGILQNLHLPTGLDGRVWLHRSRDFKHGPMHRHEELELNLVVRGRAVYLIDERRYDLEAGTSLWLFPDQDHLLIEESPDHLMWIAVFRPPMLDRICVTPATRELQLPKPVSRFARTLDASTRDRLARMCEELAVCEEDPPLYNAGLAYLALAAWSAHQQAEVYTPRSDVHPAVERAARLLRADSEPSSMEDLARRAGLSVSQLSRLFHRQTGVSLVRYRMMQRLERFRTLYGLGRRRNLTEAALAAGFGSYAQFHRAFKQVYGYGPREHRRRVNAESS